MTALNPHHRLSASTFAAIAFYFLAFTASLKAEDADARLFGFVYEATTEEKGEIEFETWATWRTPFSIGDERTDLFVFRHELEFGVTDNLQLGLYVADWTYRDRGSNRGAAYEGGAVELIYKLTDPEKQSFGSALYGEFVAGDRFLELEGKFILQKNVGRLVIAYNATLAAEWEGDGLAEKNGELEQSFGASYPIASWISLGAEFLQAAEIPDWSSVQKSAVYAGPNACLHKGRFSATITPLIELTSRADEPDFQTRLIFGIAF